MQAQFKAVTFLASVSFSFSNVQNHSLGGKENRSRGKVTGAAIPLSDYSQSSMNGRYGLSFTYVSAINATPLNFFGRENMSFPKPCVGRQDTRYT